MNIACPFPHNAFTQFIEHMPCVLVPKTPNANKQKCTAKSVRPGTPAHGRTALRKGQYNYKLIAGQVQAAFN